MIRRSAAVAALVIGCFGATSAGAIVQVVGSTRAKGCMNAAFAGASDRSAIRTCTAALADEALTPQDRAGTFVNRGVVHMNRRDYAAAILDFEAAERISPALGEAPFNRGSALIALSRYDEGVAEINRGLNMGMREPAKAYYNRALAREELRDTRGAYLDYREAARLQPEWDLPRLELARFTVRQ